jgi:hypothetical protein
MIGVFGFLALQAVRSYFGHFDPVPIQSVPRAIIGVLPASASGSSLP